MATSRITEIDELTLSAAERAHLDPEWSGYFDQDEDEPVLVVNWDAVPVLTLAPRAPGQTLH